MRARYRSPYGTIASAWRLEKGVLRLDVTVPPGTTATVHVPTSAPEAVTEGGRPASQSHGVQAAGVAGGKAVFRVESGEYSFEAPLKRPGK